MNDTHRLAAQALWRSSSAATASRSRASLSDPLAAFAWLADLAVEQGDPIRAGEIVLTGALGPMVPFVRGKRYRLEIAGFEPLEVFAE